MTAKNSYALIFRLVICSLVLSLLIVQAEGAAATDIEYATIKIPLEEGQWLTADNFTKGLMAHFNLAIPEMDKHGRDGIDLSGMKGWFMLRGMSAIFDDEVRFSLDEDYLNLIYKREDALEVKRAVKHKAAGWLMLLLSQHNPQSSPSRAIQARGGRLKKVNQHQDGQPTIILVHGLDSGPACFQAIVRAFEAEWNLYYFRYANDQALPDSARDLSAALESLNGQRVNILSHSMGGLVVRAYLSDPELINVEVERFLMLAPPNNGSSFSRLRLLMELWEGFDLLAANDSHMKFIQTLEALLQDGLGEAGDDLAPDSLFLQRLNRKQLPAGVTVGIVAGTSALLTDEEFEQMADWLKERAQNTEGLTGAGLALIASHFTEMSALCHGKGDLVVALESARLPDVDYFKTVNRNHLSIMAVSPQGPVYQLIKAFFAED